MSDERAAFEEWAILEEWRTIPEFEGVYEASSMGKVRRVGKAAIHGAGHGGGARRGHIRRPQIVRGGYEAVQLWRDGEQFPRLVHRLVAITFLGPIPDGQEVNHIDGNKRNNGAANLEYVTRSENMVHAYRIGLRHHPGRYKVTDADIAIISANHGKLSNRELGRRLGISWTTVGRIVRGLEVAV